MWFNGTFVASWQPLSGESFYVKFDKIVKSNKYFNTQLEGMICAFAL